MKYPMQSLILVTSLLSFTTACNESASSSAAEKGGFVVSGQLRNAPAGTPVYLAELTEGQFVSRDTVKTDAQGRFTLKGSASEPTIYQIKLNEENNVLVALNNQTKLQLTGDASKLGATYAVKGSKDSEVWQQMSRAMTRHGNYMGGIMRRFQANAQAGRQDSMQLLEQKFYAAKAKSTAELKGIIKKNPTSVVTAFVLGEPQLFNADENFGFADSVATQLTKAAPNSRYTQALVQKLEPMRKTAIGTVAPDISLPAPDGKAVALSSLRGKYVLLDFWASWCGPCRQENPNVVRTFDKYKGKNFTVFGVSLDQDKNKWLKAIDNDKLAWTHVSDLKGWQSAAGQAYGIQSIPMNFLLDPQGKIIAKNLRGPALEEKLAQLLK
ncbi:TlpA disulfide reductase family protein [Hymenobacter latericus]|uniref:TlpA disulfide reductase family protein n=1 Tax=Hymenobacter sp. YIM 151858-1 TaxID=2987688 RepID=UPI00222796AF|nr:TlpA disulfide reductase family protein [Hymenobacter sp. YIM 151858-1]UYZ60031.1 AhpC/TSA family protein [Hymenobacter sp. YIM 151858-1]